MGLYYQAILSSLLLNFLPDLPTTFFTPQSPILFFFTLAFTFFSLFLPHYCRFSTTKKKRKKKEELTLLPLSGQLTFHLIFFHTKVPIFCEDCRPELTEAYHNFKDGDLDTEPLKRHQNKWQPLTFIAGALTVVSKSLWRMACPHLIDLSPSKFIVP